MIDFGTQKCTLGGNSHTARVPSCFNTRYISGKSRSNGNKGKGITPNNKTLSMLAVSNPVPRASRFTIRTFFKSACFTFFDTSSTNPDHTSIAIKQPWSPINFAAGIVKNPVPHPTSNTICPGWISAPRRVFIGLKSQHRSRLPIITPAGLEMKFSIFEFPKSSIFIFNLLTLKIRPYFSFHKVLAGIRIASGYCGDEPIPRSLKPPGPWARGREAEISASTPRKGMGYGTVSFIFY